MALQVGAPFIQRGTCAHCLWLCKLLRGGEILIGPSSPPLFIALVSLSRDATKRIGGLLALLDVTVNI